MLSGGYCVANAITLTDMHDECENRGMQAGNGRASLGRYCNCPKARPLAGKKSVTQLLCYRTYLRSA